MILENFINELDPLLVGIEAWGKSSHNLISTGLTFLTSRKGSRTLRPNALGYFKPSGRITINYRFFFASGAEHRHRFDRHKSFSLFAFSNAHFRDSGSLCPIECIPRQFEPTRKCNKKRILSIKRYLNPSSLSNDIPLQLRQRSINPSQRLTKRERERKRESKNIYHAFRFVRNSALYIPPEIRE